MIKIFNISRVFFIKNKRHCNIVVVGKTNQLYLLEINYDL